MNKIARTDHPVQSFIANRWSPYAFAERDVADDELASLLEAARWAPSSYNEQPWRFLIARKRDEQTFDAALSGLVDANRAWANAAPVLIYTVASLTFERNGKPNRHALHDVGLAIGNLSAEATARGLSIHQMAGILPDRVREVFSVPEGFEPVTAVAIGYVAQPSEAPAELAERDRAPRSRRPLSEIAFTGRWGEAAV